MKSSHIALIVSAALCALSSLANAQLIISKPVPPGLKIATTADCRPAIEAEMKEFPIALQEGQNRGKIDAAETAYLTKAHNEVIAAQKTAMADNKLTPAECTMLHAKIRSEHAMLHHAIASLRGAPRLAAHPANPGACRTMLNAEQANFTKLMGDKRISPAEASVLNKMHGDLLAAEKAAMADNNLSGPECTMLAARIKTEHSAITEALDGTVAGPDCKKAIDTELAAFPAAIAKGMADKKLSKAEVDNLNKLHATLLATEKTALADGAISGSECRFVISKIRREHAALTSALASPVGAPFKAPAPPACGAAGTLGAHACEHNVRAHASCATMKTAIAHHACIAEHHATKKHNCALAGPLERASCERSNLTRMP